MSTFLKSLVFHGKTSKTVPKAYRLRAVAVRPTLGRSRAHRMPVRPPTLDIPVNKIFGQANGREQDDCTWDVSYACGVGPVQLRQA